jgi:DUF2934 family protein
MVTTAVPEPRIASGEGLPASNSAAETSEVPKVETMAERHRMISEAAYFRAERRSFALGAELDDWLQAEADIDRKMQSGGSRSTHAAAAQKEKPKTRKRALGKQ